MSPELYNTMESLQPCIAISIYQMRLRAWTHPKLRQTAQNKELRLLCRFVYTLYPSHF